MSVAALGCSLAVAQLMGALHVPVFDPYARMGALFLGPSLLALFLPLAVAVRQHLVGRRALPWLLLAALGPLVVLGFLGVTVLPWAFCIGCSTIN